MRRIAYLTIALAGLMAAPIAMAPARADDVHQDRRDVRQDEHQLRRDEARERHEMREGDVAGAARAERQEQRDQTQLRRDEHDLARDRAERRD